MDLNTVESVLTGPEVMAQAAWPEGDAYLAGGTWLFSEPQPGVRRLRDLTTLGWPALTGSDAGLDIAATCTLAELSAYEPPRTWTAAPLIRQCCEALLGSFKVQEVATVGGNLCLSLPAGPMTSLAAALDGVVTLWATDGRVRQVPAVSFVTGVRSNVLAPGELLRSVQLPTAALTARTAYRRFSLSDGGRSAGLVVGRADADGATVLTVTASTVRPVQLRFARPPGRAAVRAALAAAGPVWTDDVHGLPRWRAELTELYLNEVRAELPA